MNLEKGQGPKPITIEEYKSRQAKARPQRDLAHVPKVCPPKRRGGFLVTRRRERARLLRIVNDEVPPSWEVATEIWKRIDCIEAQMEAWQKCKQQQH